MVSIQDSLEGRGGVRQNKNRVRPKDVSTYGVHWSLSVPLFEFPDPNTHVEVP